MNLLTMVTDYKDKGERVDEVLFQEVMKVVKHNRKSNDLLQKLYLQMGRSADSDIKLWLEIKSYVKDEGGCP